MESDSDNKQQRLSKLLPWYVNGTLAGEERAQLERYAEQDPTGQAEARLLRSLQAAIREQQDEVVSPAELGWQRLQKTINEQRRQTPQGKAQNRWWKPTLAVAALLLVIQSTVLLQIWPVYRQHYTVLSSAPQGAVGVVLQLSVNPTVSEQRLREMINSVDAQIVGGPGALGIYRLQLPENIKQIGTINRLIERLRATAGVTAVQQE